MLLVGGMQQRALSKIEADEPALLPGGKGVQVFSERLLIIFQADVLLHMVSSVNRQTLDFR